MSRGRRVVQFAGAPPRHITSTRNQFFPRGHHKVQLPFSIGILVLRSAGGRRHKLHEAAPITWLLRNCCGHGVTTSLSLLSIKPALSLAAAARASLQWNWQVSVLEFDITVRVSSIVCHWTAAQSKPLRTLASFETSLRHVLSDFVADDLNT